MFKLFLPAATVTILTAYATISFSTQTSYPTICTEPMTAIQIRALSALMISEVSWALLLVSSSLAVTGLDLDPFLFSTLQLFSGGIVLTLLSRQSLNWRDFMLDRYTLIYGLARVGTGAFFTAALVHITSSSASMLGIFNMPKCRCTVVLLP